VFSVWRHLNPTLVGQKISTTDSPSHVEHHDIYEQENFAGKLLLVLQTWAMLYAKFAATIICVYG
jgi:hypothetical protein